MSENTSSDVEGVLNFDDFKKRAREASATAHGRSKHTVTKPQPKPEGDVAIESELEWARRFVAAHGDDLLHVWEWARWFVWDGARWNDARQDEVRRRAKSSARKRTRKALNEGTEAIRLARAAESSRGIEATLKLAASELEVAVPHGCFDSDPMLLNVRNGTVDLRTGDLRPHRRTDHITKLAPVTFDGDAQCPTWTRMLSEILPDPEVRDFLRRYLGYCLTGDISEQVLAFFYGEGANGKSTLLGLLQQLMGDYCCLAPSGLLIAKRHEAHPTELTVLHGRRLAVCSEIEAGNRLAEVQVKQLTGGDPITARRMREDFWTFDPTHKLIIAGNHKPKVRGTDEAIWRRLRLVPFSVIIPEHQRDRRLPERLAAEMPGILSWLVAGCLEWQERGLAAPGAVLAATDSYRAEEDRVGAFLDECCQLGENLMVAKGNLHRAYVEWAKASGEHPMSKKALGTEMKRRQIDEDKDSSGKRFWLGVALI